MCICVYNIYVHTYTYDCESNLPLQKTEKGKKFLSN